jgi:prephenate dehydrogenase
MKDAVIGIVGGTGGMGSWFAGLLQKDGYTVHVWGRKSVMNINDLVKLCDVLVISVPISATASMIQKVGPLLNENKLLMDLTSLKKEPVKLMLASTSAEVIGCHPLFGPLLADIAGKNVVLCPARGHKWLTWLRVLMQKSGLVVIEKSPEEHDKMMVIVQALNHLNTVTLGLVLADTGIEIAEIHKFATPIFQTKMEIIKKVFTENPGLYTDIIAQNPLTMNMLDLYEKTLADIRALVQSGDGTQLKEAIEKAAKKLFL